MHQPPRLLVFDLDGTLIDSSLDLCNAVNAALLHVGRQELPHTLIASYIGDGAAMLVRRALGDPGDADSAPGSIVEGEQLFERAFHFFLGFYHEHKLDNTRLYDGVMDTLRLIRDLHPSLPMAVLTNKPVRPSRAICEALGVSPFFFQNYGGDSFPTKKPEPAGLLRLIEEASALTGSVLTAEETVMIGDSDVDVLTARHAGTRSLGCGYGLSAHALSLAQPDMLVAQPAEWVAALGLIKL